MHLNYTIAGFLLFWIIFVFGRVLSVNKRYSHNPKPELRSLRSLLAWCCVCLVLILLYAVFDVNNWYFSETGVRGIITILLHCAAGVGVSILFSKFEDNLLGKGGK